jgi:HNH endonuclease
MPKLDEIKRGSEIGKSPADRYIWQACSDCGQERWVHLEGEQSRHRRCKSCSKRGNRCYNWKGGRILRADGYIEVWIAPNDFFYPMVCRRGYILEHRLIMAKHLNRCLSPWEVVHHENGIRNDNRIENLAILKCQSDHFVTIQMQKQINKQQEEIDALKKQIALLAH